MTAVFAIDPGQTRSAWLLLADDYRVVVFGIDPNENLIGALRGDHVWAWDNGVTVVIEKIEGYGMPVGREVFETVLWIGRFIEALHPTPVVLMPRREVKLELTGSPKAKDVNIRAALIDRLGAPGTKAAPGPTYGITKDVWSALALAVTYTARKENGHA